MRTDLEFDFSRLELIRNFDEDLLVDDIEIENLILACGINDESTHEFPASILKHAGGFFIWQYPNQFSKYLNVLREFPVSSYLEIGCRWGGSFIFTVEYLSRFQTIEKAVGIDLNLSNIAAYQEYNPFIQFHQMHTSSEIFKQFMNDDIWFDVIFIDGDHTYDGVNSDFLLCKDHTNILVFHDIQSISTIDVNIFWNKQFRELDGNGYYLFEFLDQYDDLPAASAGSTFLGIGIAVKAEYLNELNSQSGGQYEHVLNRAVNKNMAAMRRMEYASNLVEGRVEFVQSTEF